MVEVSVSVDLAADVISKRFRHLSQDTLMYNYQLIIMPHTIFWEELNSCLEESVLSSSKQ